MSTDKTAIASRWNAPGGALRERTRWGRRGLGLGAAWLLGLAPAQAGAEEPTAAASGQAAPTVAPAPNVGLDQLLRLPNSYERKTDSQPRVGGASAEEWRSRFAEADAQLAAAQRELRDARATMEAASSDSSQRQMSAPGARANSDASSGLSVQNRQRVRRSREEVEEAERRRRALEVEADLAGVPPEWRK